MTARDQWNRVYSSRPIERLGWYAPRLATSLAWIRELGMPLDAPILDVGGGASTLADDLLEAGFRSITVLDLSEVALAAARTRLGDRAARVSWIEGDVATAALPPARYPLWHDRALFHFLLSAPERRKYREALLGALAEGGRVIIGTFAPGAPPSCSGLPVRRYDRTGLAAELGPAFVLERFREETHVAPSGTEQRYLYCLFRRIGRRERPKT